LFTVGKAVLLFNAAVEAFNYFKSQFQKKNSQVLWEIGDCRIIAARFERIGT
jgi:hypothetical protein